MNTIFTILLLTINLNIFSQFENMKFNFVTIEEGLSSNDVVTSYKDKFGFLWIGNKDGLNKYDGYKVIIYKSIDFDSTSLSNNSISHIIEDKQGNLWIGTTIGLNKYNYETDNFTRYNHNPLNKNSIISGGISFLFVDSEGLLWIGTNKGLSVMNVVTGIVINYPDTPGNPNAYFGKDVTYITQDKEGIIWIGSWTGGLISYNKRTNNFKHYMHNPNNKNGLATNNIIKILIDNEGLFWLGSYLSRGGTYNPKTGIFKQFEAMVENNSAPGTEFIYQKSIDEIWMSERLGLVIYNKKDKTKRFITNIPSDPASIPIGICTHLYIDNTGIIWLVSAGVLCYYDPNQDKFFHTYRKFDVKNCTKPYKPLQNYVGSGIEDTATGNLWFSTFGDGVFVYDPITKKYDRIFNVPNDKTSLPNNYVKYLAFDYDRNIWVGTFNGISIMNAKTHKVIKNLIANPNNPNSIQNNMIEAIYFDKHRNVWIGTTEGLDVMNYDTKIFNHINDKNMQGYASRRIFDFCEDNEDNIWFGPALNQGCLFSYNYNTKKITYYKSDVKTLGSISSESICDIFRDSKGQIWVATANGLNLYNNKTKKFTVFNSKNGFIEDYFRKIQEDNNGNIWIISQSGFSIFNPKTKAVRNFDARDGLVTNSGMFLKTQNGTFCLNDQYSGIYLFNPDSVKYNSNIPSVYFTDFQLYNKSVPISPNGPLTKNINFTKEITLNYYHSVFSFEFAAINYTLKEKNNFAYKLEGFDKEWIYTNSKKRYVTYTNLEPGKYMLKVKASNNDNVWNEKGTQITITIIPPFWKTLWFRIIFPLFIISLIVFIVYYRINILNKQKRILEINVEKRTLELQKAINELQISQRKIERVNSEIQLQNIELASQKDSISKLNEELNKYAHQMESLVAERTKELEAAKIKAEQSDKLKSSFLCNMSHEIRTPMNAILGFLFLLNKDDLETQKRKSYIQLINSNSKSLLNLIDDILDISKIEANELIIQPEFTSIQSFFNEVYNKFNFSLPSAKRNSITLKLTEPQDLVNCKIKIDVFRLEQVLSNLITNAIKFTDSGYVEIGYNLIENNNITTLQVFVKDSGIGIDAQNLEFIFDRFTKIETETSRLFRGVGLGLSISKKITELMGGQIWVKSIINKGSTFYVEIPVLTDKINNILDSIQAKPTNELNWSNLTILLVEDEDVNMFYLSSIIEDTGATILKAQNGIEAIDIFFTQKIDIVLMDIKMPLMNGFEAINIIREKDKTTPIIAQTGYAMNHEIDEIKVAGFNAYITKPYLYDDIINIIEKTLA